MTLLVHGFLRCMLVYHLLHTVLVYGAGVSDPFVFSVLKDGLRIGIVVVSLLFLLIQKKGRNALQSIVRPAVGVGVLVIMSYLMRYPAEGDMLSFLIGIKYDLYPLVVLVTAGVVAIAYVCYTHTHKKAAQKLLRMIFGVVMTALIGGYIRQISKLLFPDLLSGFGYGPVGDYLLGEHPPLYYRTGPGGMMRLSGLFAGPNNYGYFLVAFFSRTVRYTTTKISTKRKQRAIAVLYMIAVVRTLSRGARIGIGVQLVALARWRYPQRRRYVPWLIGVGCLGFIGISRYKAGSTIGHLVARQDGLQALMTNIRGYGPGSAGPSVHYAGVYLPENQYLQILLDIGIHGFIIRIAVIVLVLRALKARSREHRSQSLTPAVQALVLGFLGLAVEGLFLHVLEDSAVNYLFFVSLRLVAAMQHQQVKSTSLPS